MMMHILTMHHLLVTEILVAEGLKILEETYGSVGSHARLWDYIMARKSALEKIEYHEKICRIMQRQTFEQIQQLKNQIIRIERILIGTAAFVIISLLEKII
jgi:23S rRNA A2030 N6-methylase RlmJ